MARVDFSSASYRKYIYLLHVLLLGLMLCILNNLCLHSSVYGRKIFPSCQFDFLGERVLNFVTVDTAPKIILENDWG